MVSDPLEGTAYRAQAATSAWTFAAEHAPTSRPVLVRLLPAELLARPELADRLRLEARVLARLDHPNVLELLDLGVTRAGFPFVVTEPPPGRSLAAELAARGALPPDEAVALAVQALAGLSAAHASGVVHRDVRPEHLFVAAGAVEVTAFGLAPLVAAATPAALVGDWARYVSPEQARGEDTDERADIYAMGLVVHQMIAGADPFAAHARPIDLLRAHATEAPAPLSRCARGPVSAEIEAAVLRALAKRPEERFPCARDFAEALGKGTAAARRPDLRALLRTEPTPGTRAKTSFASPTIAELAREIVQRRDAAKTLEASRPRPPETVDMPEGMPLPRPTAAPARAGAGAAPRPAVLPALAAAAATAGLLTGALELARVLLR